MATRTLSIEEYLNGPEPDPDAEYVDGELKARNIGYSIHALMQMETGCWFEQHADAWGVIPAFGVRVRVSASRVRLPDIVVAKIGPWPPTLVEPPLIAIEVLSPLDSFTELIEKLRDYAAMGIPNIWIIDPQVRRSWSYEGSGLIQKSRFTVTDSTICLDVPEIFAWYDRCQKA